MPDQKSLFEEELERQIREREARISAEGPLPGWTGHERPPIRSGIIAENVPLLGTVRTPPAGSGNILGNIAGNALAESRYRDKVREFKEREAVRSKVQEFADKSPFEQELERSIAEKEQTRAFQQAKGYRDLAAQYGEEYAKKVYGPELGERDPRAESLAKTFGLSHYTGVAGNINPEETRKDAGLLGATLPVLAGGLTSKMTLGGYPGAQDQAAQATQDMIAEGATKGALELADVSGKRLQETMTKGLDPTWWAGVGRGAVTGAGHFIPGMADPFLKAGKRAFAPPPPRWEDLPQEIKEAHPELEQMGPRNLGGIKSDVIDLARFPIELTTFVPGLLADFGKDPYKTIEERPFDIALALGAFHPMTGGGKKLLASLKNKIKVKFSAKELSEVKADMSKALVLSDPSRESWKAQFEPRFEAGPDSILDRQKPGSVEGEIIPVTRNILAEHDIDQRLMNIGAKPQGIDRRGIKGAILDRMMPGLTVQDVTKEKNPLLPIPFGIRTEREPGSKWWRDNVIDAADSWPQSRGTPAQFEAHLNKVKGARMLAEETGLLEWMKDKPLVTRDEIMKYQRDNMFKVGEDIRPESREDDSSPSFYLPPESYSKERASYGPEGHPNWSTEGGEPGTYREIVLTTTLNKGNIAELQGKIDDLKHRLLETNNLNLSRAEISRMTNHHNYLKRVMDLLRGRTEYLSPHWGRTKDVAVHLRLQDRYVPVSELEGTNPELAASVRASGREEAKILWGDEVQSDQAQEARKLGIKPPPEGGYDPVMESKFLSDLGKKEKAWKREADKADKLRSEYQDLVIRVNGWVKDVFTNWTDNLEVKGQDWGHHIWVLENALTRYGREGIVAERKGLNRLWTDAEWADIKRLAEIQKMVGRPEHDLDPAYPKNLAEGTKEGNLKEKRRNRTVQGLIEKNIPEKLFDRSGGPGVVAGPMAPGNRAKVFAMKRLLEEAAQGGYDGVMMTRSGEQYKRWGSEAIMFRRIPLSEWQDNRQIGERTYLGDRPRWEVATNRQMGGLMPTGTTTIEQAAIARAADPRVGRLKDSKVILTKGALRDSIETVVGWHRGEYSPENYAKYLDGMTEKVWQRMNELGEGESDALLPRKEGMAQVYDREIGEILDKLGKNYGQKTNISSVLAGEHQKYEELKEVPKEIVDNVVLYRVVNINRPAPLNVLYHDNMGRATNTARMYGGVVEAVRIGELLPEKRAEVTDHLEYDILKKINSSPEGRAREMAEATLLPTPKTMRDTILRWGQGLMGLTVYDINRDLDPQTMLKMGITQAEIDKAGRPVTVGSIIRANMGEDRASIDVDGQCPRSLQFANTVAVIEHALKRRLPTKKVYEVGKWMREHNIETACPTCYTMIHRVAGDMYATAVKNMGTYDRGDLQKWARKNPADLEVMRAHSGLRFQSNTDWKPQHTGLLMNTIADASSLRLHGSAYFKQMDFMHIFWPSRMMMNGSLGGDIVGGVLVPNLEYGIDWKPVFDFRDKYDNIGTGFVGKSDAEIILAGDHPKIDHIIGYHASGMSKEIQKYHGFEKDYSDVLEESWKPGLSESQKQAFRDKFSLMVKQKYGMSEAPWARYDRTSKLGSKVPLITDLMHKGDMGVFLRLVDDFGMIPRYSEFIGKFKDPKNYMKLVGPAAGRRGADTFEPMVPKFDFDVANDVITKWRKDGGYAKENAFSPKTVQHFIKEFASVEAYRNVAGELKPRRVSLIEKGKTVADILGPNNFGLSIRDVNKPDEGGLGRPFAVATRDPQREAFRQEVAARRAALAAGTPAGKLAPSGPGNVVKRAQGKTNSLGITDVEVGEVMRYKDLPPPIREDIWFGYRMANPIRIFDRYPLLKREIYDRIVDANNESIRWKKQNAEDVKRWSNMADSKTIGAHRISRMSGGPEALLLDNMIAKRIDQLTPGELQVIREMDLKYKATFDEFNRMRVDVGSEPIPPLADYTTFAVNLPRLREMGFDVMRDSVQTIYEQLSQNPYTHPNQIAFRYAKKRSGAIVPLHMDAYKIYENYMNAAADTILKSPHIAKLRLLLSDLPYASVDKNGKPLKNTFSVKEKMPILYSELTEWADHVSGKRLPTPNLDKMPGVRKIMTSLSTSIPGAMLSASLRTVMTQPASMLWTAHAMGPKFLAEGIMKSLTPEGHKFASEMSRVLGSRIFESVQHDLSQSEFASKASNLKRKVIETGMIPLKMADYEMAVWTWRAAYEKAIAPIEKGGMGLEQGSRGAVVFADDIVTKTQASAARHDLVPAQRTTAWRIATSLQTFVISEYNYMKKDVFGSDMGKRSPKERALRIARFALAATVLDELYEGNIMRALGINRPATRSPFSNPVGSIIDDLRAGKKFGEMALNVGREMAEPIPVIGGMMRWTTPQRPSFPAPVQVAYDLGASVIKLSQAISTGDFSKFNHRDVVAVGKVLGIPATAQFDRIIRGMKKGDPLFNLLFGTVDYKEAGSKGGPATRSVLR